MIGALLPFQLVLSMVALGYAAYCDVKTREVSNWVWLIYGVIAGVGSVVQFLISDAGLGLVLYLGIVGAVSVLSIVVFYVGGWGGADAKAVMCLSISLGFYVVNMAILAVISYLVFALVLFTYRVQVRRVAFKTEFAYFKKGCNYELPFIAFLFAALCIGLSWIV